MKDDPIILFGAPRSGTTYLNAILNKQPGVFITHETRVFAWLHSALQSAAGRPQLVRSHADQFRDYLGPALAHTIREFYRSMRPSAEHWGDKNPHYASEANRGCLDTIATLYPGARFIHIMRDGRDVVTSLVRKTTPDGKPWTDFESAHRAWVSHVENARDFCARNPERSFELKYEQLVRDDAACAASVFDFLGLEMGNDVVDFCHEQARERTPLSGPTRPLTDTLASEWASVFDTDQQTRSMQLLEEQLTRLGYLRAA